ncbi:hypothetical protein NZK33_04760 [Cyanobium sp. FGCU-6]|nr:hypothetical protein [Cyanobium sp. FGCU6]
MPTNTQMERCIAQERGALVFWSPEEEQRGPGARVQIIDVFALEVASGFGGDAQGGLRLEAQPSMAAGRSWTLARAAQLIRNDAQPHRWVALQLDRRAWGLFWAGGGLQECRQRLADGSREAQKDPQRPLLPVARNEPWRLVAWTSLIWAAVLGLTIGIFLGLLQRQERQLEQLRQRNAPAQQAR